MKRITSFRIAGPGRRGAFAVRIEQYIMHFGKFGSGKKKEEVSLHRAGK
jgi:hypothetical protein